MSQYAFSGKTQDIKFLLAKASNTAGAKRTNVYRIDDPRRQGDKIRHNVFFRLDARPDYIHPGTRPRRGPDGKRPEGIR
jgi:hypothetical protein